MMKVRINEEQRKELLLSLKDRVLDLKIFPEVERVHKDYIIALELLYKWALERCRKTGEKLRWDGTAGIDLNRELAILILESLKTGLIDVDRMNSLIKPIIEDFNKRAYIEALSQ